MTTVLLAEDDPEVRKKYAASLEMSGFKVIMASDGLEIEAIVPVTPVDIIVSDTNLESRDGDIACKNLIKQGKLSGVLIIGMSDDGDADQYWKGIAYDFLYKGGIDNLGTAVMPRYEKFIS
ncbi:MAG: response regulator [Phycisphaerales bacterium]|nr:response regulator [Phycisphaerales bacterium]